MEVQSFVWLLMCFCAVEIARFVVEESSFGNRPAVIVGNCFTCLLDTPFRERTWGRLSGLWDVGGFFVLGSVLVFCGNRRKSAVRFCRSGVRSGVADGSF